MAMTRSRTTSGCHSPTKTTSLGPPESARSYGGITGGGGTDGKRTGKAEKTAWAHVLCMNWHTYEYILYGGALPPESGDLGRVTRSPSTTLTNLPTSALLRPPQVAMVEVQLDHDTKVPPGMLVAFAICTTMLVAVHMLDLMISTCILPNIEVVCNLHSISLVHESPHERLHWYIETAWAFSTLLGLILFLLEIAILCWVKFYDLSPPAAWSACVVLIPVMIIFLAFPIHFYRSLVTHKYEVTVSGIRELEILKEQMEQDHLEHHNNHNRNNGIHYGAAGDIV
ncbi:calcium release-activated calcium channel protein 1-like [Drosophila miranda]|uniref:calcium release-activated calcium channel protein 1-like n=1 Tax=Drosophila miranda TaxID=7229 RepID=UPI00143F2731|nr:calcium release-activated calcium channel protein 1-like [Drosophila miranda]